MPFILLGRQTYQWLFAMKIKSSEMLLLQEFGITEPDSNFSLCEVLVAEGGFV